VAKVPFTTDFVEAAVEQGEKVLVYSCFTEPLRKIRAHFGDAALLLTGSTPPTRRQKIVARFQGDPSVRVLLATVVAGGLGPNLTASRQVIFNDLDWVAANHWLAEARVARVGRAGTVNVSYVVGARTVDEFVQRVLETKTAMVSTVVDSEAIVAEIGADVFTGLELALAALPPGEASEETASGQESDVLRRIAAQMEAGGDDGSTIHHVGASGLSRDALLRLAEILGGAPARRFRAESTAAPDGFLILDVDGRGDVTCSCAGFDPRSGCDHATQLEEWLSTGGPLPDGYSLEADSA
jgi:hypothetical protein